MSNLESIRLGVNVDHVATVRQARGTDYPDPVATALQCESMGVYGITAHLREDRRHIQDDDIYRLKDALRIPLNLEMACTPEIVDIALEVQPAEVCIVPERREELTTEGGLSVAGNEQEYAALLNQLMDAGIQVSLFIEADDIQLEAAARLGVPCVELHTGTYCDAGKDERARELQRLISGSEKARALGLQVNAGHGINMQNIDGILEIPYLDTLNIGHSIIARAITVGLSEAVSEMLKAMSNYAKINGA